MNELTHQLLSENNIKENRFFGKFLINANKKPHLVDLISKEEGNLLLINGWRQIVYIPESVANKLKEGEYFEFSIQVKEIKEDKAFILPDLSREILKLDENPYQKIIRLRYERLDNPEANKMIANLMREIGKGMYSSKKRMIFELLQNADDTASEEPIKFIIDSKNDYFLVMHNGLPFNKDDVEAITSAAESTKNKDRKKTGYKGIGFKSVFTDSKEVFIKSGGFLFAFDRHYQKFEHFDEFYYDKERYRKYPDLLAEDKLKHKKQRESFNGNRDIPWQVIPVWKESLPNDLEESRISQYNNNVGFAINFGKTKIPGYLTAIQQLSEDPRFLLFLRGTAEFKSFKNGITISRTSDNPLTITLDAKDKEKEFFSYFKKEIREIPVNDVAFQNAGLTLKKSFRKNEYDEVHYFFLDEEGQEIENIPSKLAAIDDTTIIFAVPFEEAGINAEKRYLKKKTYSSFYTFLPMEEKRIQLPFLVNADFVPSSNREEIQGDNLWNIYLISVIAKEHVKWIEEFALGCQTSFQRNYLNLLLDDKLPEDHSASSLISKYNDIYLENLRSSKIIYNTDSEPQKLKDTILDLSGFTKIFSTDSFYTITKTTKRLPHIALRTNALRPEYLGIEKIEKNDIVDLLKYPDSQEIFKKEILVLSDEKYNEALDWIDKLGEVEGGINVIKDLPFLRYKNEVYSITEFLQLQDVWVLAENIYPIAAIIQRIGFEIIQLSLPDHQYISNVLSQNSYLSESRLVFEKLTSKSLLHLDPKEKISLISFLLENENMKGVGEVMCTGKLILFSGNSGKGRPLAHLMKPFSGEFSEFFLDFFIKNEELEILPENLSKYLIRQDSVFERLLLNIELFNDWSSQFNESNYLDFVGIVKIFYLKVEEIDKILPAKISAIPWFYVIEEQKFHTLDSIYFTKGLELIEEDKFAVIKTKLTPFLKKPIPNKAAGQIIDLFNLKYDQKATFEIFDHDSTFSLSEANVFLDYLELNKEEDFLPHKNFEKHENNYILRKSKGVVFHSSPKLREYIEKSIERTNSPNLIPWGFLEEELYSENRYKIGLLEKERLLKTIIKKLEFDVELASYISNTSDNELLKKFLLNLKSLELSSDEIYDLNNPVQKYFLFLLKLLNINENGLDINEFKNRITIDTVPITKLTISNDVSFNSNTGNRKLLKLVDILKAFEGKTDLIDKFFNNLHGMKDWDLGKLKETLFKVEPFPKNQIHLAILRSPEKFLSAHQCMFYSLWETEKSLGQSAEHKLNISELKPTIASVEINSEGSISFIKSILDLSYSLQTVRFSSVFLGKLSFRQFVLGSQIAEEKLPAWIDSWLNEADRRTKELHLEKLGLHTEKSDVVQLRKSILSMTSSADTLITLFNNVLNDRQNDIVMINTYSLLFDRNEEIITHAMPFITRFLNVFKDLPSNHTYTPIISRIEKSKKYILADLKTIKQVYNIDSIIGDNLKEKVVQTLSGKGLKFIDNETTFSQLQKNSITIIAENIQYETDFDLLEKNSEPLGDNYYKSWSYYKNYQFLIINGLNGIPKLLKYRGELIDRQVDSELTIANQGNKYFFILGQNGVLEDHLKNVIPEDVIKSLLSWKDQCERNPEIMDVHDGQYSDAVKNIIQDRFGIPPDHQREVNNNAIIKTLDKLEKLGYNINNVMQSGFDNSLLNIKSPSGIDITCYIRSAQKGLLYLTPSNWEKLGESNTILSVIVPGSTANLYKTQEELLQADHCINLLFKIENPKSPSVVNQIIEVIKRVGKEPNMMLTTSREMHNNLFEKIMDYSKRTSEFKVGDSSTKKFQNS
jgi:hypothetical protein